MSTDKLNQSLDEIMKDSKTGRKGRGGKPVRKAAAKAKVAVAPTDGVTKNRRGARPVTTAPAVAAPATIGDNRILISGLSADVSEDMLKEYFTKQYGKVNKVLLTYNQHARSTGNATVYFAKPSTASDAARGTDGIMIDKRPIKVELIVSAKKLDAPAPAKTLSDRVSQPRNAAREKAKPATNGKSATNGANVAKDAKKGGRVDKKSGRAGRPKKKTAEELDAEMQDYFGGDSANGATTNGDAAINGAAPAVPATNGGDTGMDDEIS